MYILDSLIAARLAGMDSVGNGETSGVAGNASAETNTAGASNAPAGTEPENGGAE